MLSHKTNSYIKALLAVFLGKFLTIIKLSFVVGSHAVMFSASNLCLPLVGLFGHIGGATCMWACLLAVRLFSAPFTASALAFYVPGYAAALYLATTSRILRCGIPLLAFFLFCIHPVGAQAMLYSCYWFIPMVIGAVCGRSLFAQMLGATFTAHAVGSVIWLYTVPMNASTWLALIPLVALERITFAMGMVVAYHAINRLTVWASLLISAFNRPSVILTR